MNVTPTKILQPINFNTPLSFGPVTRPLKRPSTPFVDKCLTTGGCISTTGTESPDLHAEASGTKKRTPASQHRAGPVARRISSHRAESIRANPQCESVVAASKPKTSKRIATHVAIPAKRNQGRPSAAPKLKTPEPAIDTVDAPKTKGLGKRKRSIGSQDYTPDGKRKKSLGSEDYTPFSLKKKTRSSMNKKVAFAVPVDSSGDEDIDTPVPLKTASRKTPHSKSAGKAKNLDAAGTQAKNRLTTKTIKKRVTKE